MWAAWTLEVAVGETTYVAGMEGAVGFLWVEPQMWPQGIEG